MSLLNHTTLVQLNELTNGFGSFTSNLYQQIAQRSNENVIFSPVSILNVLVLLSTAANESTYEQMRQSLYLKNNKIITANLFHEYNELFQKNNGEATVLLANRIYVNKHYNLRKSFQEFATKKFSCGVEPMDFDNKTQAARAINDFVEEKTNKKIKKLIEPSSIDQNTGVMLINSLYFESNWKFGFNSEATTVGKFYVNENETVLVDFMRKDSLRLFRHKYVSELEASTLEMDYAKSKYSFVILLPWARTGLSTLETKLSKFDIKQHLNRKLSSIESKREVDVRIPKFKIEMTIKLKDTLKELGMVDMFDESKADFRGILDSHEPLHVSEVIHTAFIDVNESGSEAGAWASAPIILQNADPEVEHVYFIADHPFVYYIWNKEINNAIFMGRVTKFD